MRELDGAAAPGGSGAGHAQGAVLARRSTSSATTSARTRPRTGSAWRRGARCACATRASSRARDVVKDAQRRGRRAALHAGIRRRGAARARRAHRARHAALGVGGARRSRRGAALRSAVLRREPGHDEGKSFLDEINPRLARAASRARWPSRTWRRAKPGDARPVRARSATSASTRTASRASRLEPHRHASRTAGRRSRTRRKAKAKPASPRRSAGRRQARGEARRSPTPPPRRDRASTISARSICASAW